jgi:hypothetical protein
MAIECSGKQQQRKKQRDIRENRERKTNFCDFYVFDPSDEGDSPPTHHNSATTIFGQRIDSTFLSGEQEGFEERRLPLSPTPPSPQTHKPQSC